MIAWQLIDEAALWCQEILACTCFQDEKDECRLWAFTGTCNSFDLSSSCTCEFCYYSEYSPPSSHTMQGPLFEWMNIIIHRNRATLIYTHDTKKMSSVLDGLHVYSNISVQELLVPSAEKLKMGRRVKDKFQVPSRPGDSSDPWSHDEVVQDWSVSII